MVTLIVVWSGEVVIVLVELGLVEQRYQAVLEVVNQGATVTEVAVRFGVTRQTVHRWLRRYAAEGSGRVGGWVGAAVVVSASDAAGGGGADRRAAPVEPGVGSADDPVPVGGGAGGAVAGSVVDLSVSGASRSDRTRGAAAEEGGLQAVGAIAGDGAVADGRRWWGAARRRVEGVDRVRGSMITRRFVISAQVVERATARPVCDALAKAMRAYRCAAGGLDGQRQGVHRPVRAGHG